MNKLPAILEQLQRHVNELYELTEETRDEATVRTIAETFCRMDDDFQAKFFVEVAKIMSTWNSPMSNQAYYIGRHLRECDCSTEESRSFIREIFHSMERH